MGFNVAEENWSLPVEFLEHANSINHRRPMQYRILAAEPKPLDSRLSNRTLRFGHTPIVALESQLSGADTPLAGR